MIRWFCRNDVAANLLMVGLIILGMASVWLRVPLEVFPDFALDVINVQVAFRGATPGEVEDGVVIRVEEAIQDLEGIKHIRSRAAEGSGTVTVELESGYDARALMDDIKGRVDAINTFPSETERPTYSLATRRREVISVVLSGELPERELRRLGEQVRDDLADIPAITQVELTAVRAYEIAIEVPEARLDEYGLTFSEVADAVRRSSLDLSAGRIRSAGGEILLRTKGQAYVGNDFDSIVLISRDDGTRVTLADVATIRDGFEEEPLYARFNNKPCVEIDVYRVGDQNAITVANAVKEYVEQVQPTMPDGVTLTPWRDRSKIVKARLWTLVRSAIQGGLLVFILLALFLRIGVALWVCVGIPVSFMGAFLVMPHVGVTINIISLFAFILVLGIVVDDAIVTGENIYRHMRLGGDPTKAAIAGTNEVAVPVTFGVLTTIAAFVPIAMMGGTRGKLFAQIPFVVIPVLLFSLVESKLILPAHLKHLKVDGRESWLLRAQQRVANGLEWAVERFYRPVLSAALHWRYTTMAIFVGIAVVIFALVPAGKVRFVFFPRVQSEVARATLTMPQGTPVEVTAERIERIRAVAEELQAEYVDPGTGETVITNILSLTGSTGGRGSPQSHVGRVMFEIVPPEQRTLPITSSELVREWRKRIGPLAGAREVNFRAEIGRGGAPIDVQLSGQDFAELEAVAAIVSDQLGEYPAVYDITDNLNDGKEELRLRIRPQAEQLGLSMRDLARQVRQAFFGEQAQRIQRGREDVRVMVRYPEGDRKSVHDLEQMRIRLQGGSEVPFSEVAEIAPGRSFATINRVDRSRTVNVTADVNKKTADIEGIKADLKALLDAELKHYPGVRYSLEGEAQEQRESFSSLAIGAVIVLFAIYALLAIPFGSYLQPLIVMSVIPFGAAAAIAGHVVMGMDLSLLSIFGILALTGVVVNDSLVLVDYINKRRRDGMALSDAVRAAGVLRFRPILLTSLTTFAGLTPLLLERSTQAQFLIPMAVSLGFGILLTTFVTLLLVPANYLILADIKRCTRWLWHGPADVIHEASIKTTKPAVEG